jgi:alkylation response protein AidB-like acyl-CoA dehydrogenase
MAASFALVFCHLYAQFTRSIQPQKERLQDLRPFYRHAVGGELIKGMVPQPLGGMDGTVLDSAILVEQMSKVDRSLSLTIFGTGIGLSPLLLGGNKE